MGGIRSYWGLCLLWPMAAACDGSSAVVHADELVLELGGTRPSLRSELIARGQTVALAQRVRAEPAPLRNRNAPEPSAPGPGELGGADPAPVVAPPPIPIPLPEPEPVPAPPSYKTVKLQRHQTLMHLSREHLGTTQRWKEIMVLNGWSEARVNRLPEGIDVKIPLDRAR